MEYLVAWIAFVAASVSIAKGKNRNPLLWGALGLATGPFAILAIALIKPGPGADQGYQ